MSGFDKKSIKGAELQILATEIAKQLMSDGSVLAQALASLDARLKSVESARDEIGNAGLGVSGLVALMTSTTSESENFAATPKSVKSAYDSLNSAKQDKLTTTQQSAVDSGVTTEKRAEYDSHVSNSDVHVTASDKETWNGKASSSHTHKVKINGTEKTVYASNGAVCDLGDFLTQHQSLDGLVHKSGDTMIGDLTAPNFYAKERFQVKVEGTDRRIALVADSDGFAKIKGDDGRDVIVMDGSTIRAKCLWVFNNNVVFNGDQLFAKAFGDEYSNRLTESYLSFRNNIPYSFFNASMDSSGSWTYVQRWTFDCAGSKSCLYEFDFLINYDCGDDNRLIRIRVLKTGGAKDELIWTYAAYVRSHGFIHIPAKIFGSYPFMKVEIVPEMEPGHSGGSYHAMVNSVRTNLEPDAMFNT